MNGFDARAYWEERLGADWSLRGVGMKRMGFEFNRWAYRQRGERFREIVRSCTPGATGARVLDVGSGTGFYLEAWTDLGAREIVGMDLTDAAVSHLEKAFPSLQVVRNDISEDTGGLEPNSFDLISCMDVMFHIVEPRRFSAALRNVADLVAPDGYFLWSDYFLHGPEVSTGHVAWRNLYRVEEAVTQAGFDIVDRVPLFYWLGEPRDTSSRLILPSWQALIWLASRTETTGGLLGRGLYRLDRRLCERRRESPSTEVMVCRKSRD